MTVQRIKQLQEQRERALAGLYYKDMAGQVQPMNGPARHAEKEKQIEADFRAGLVALAEEADDKRRAAEDVLARVDRPLTWLNDAELARARDLAPFVAEDLGAANGSELAGALEDSLKTGDRVYQWAVMRYAARRWAELQAGERSYSYEPAAANVRAAVMPAALLDEDRRARVDLQEARDLLLRLEYADPEQRDARAIRLGLNPKDFEQATNQIMFA